MKVKFDPRYPFSLMSGAIYLVLWTLFSMLVGWTSKDWSVMVGMGFGAVFMFSVWFIMRARAHINLLDVFTTILKLYLIEVRHMKSDEHPGDSKAIDEDDEDLEEGFLQTNYKFISPKTVEEAEEELRDRVRTMIFGWNAKRKLKIVEFECKLFGIKFDGKEVVFSD